MCVCVCVGGINVLFFTMVGAKCRKLESMGRGRRGGGGSEKIAKFVTPPRADK